ncbi:hypothetical protein CkaCkLH20_00631 [Colletotrichum karsti]|uniref:Transmembrane protein 53 n=1 Tax=Colletotrichum karsti TaxID=1095194 RepID=A0A9P6IJE3_9PEZI|nr:uncharacterized protein CkaCkLH20_00631 [Colletotrichum karsti]KAF9881485.1 hypothetical protein CkaCkLH20_00631 [Colletotrichum karsti]
MSSTNQMAVERQKADASLNDKFVQLSDLVFLLSDVGNQPDESLLGEKNGPDLILIYGWGDSRLKQVARFADGFRIIYPEAKIIIILAPIFKSLFSSQEQRVQRIQPVLDEAFNSNATHLSSTKQPSILAHVLSNTGCLYFTATLEGYRQEFGHAMPHTLLIMDSVPGSMDHDTSNIGTLADAVALDAKSRVPWPPQVTKAFCIILLYVMRAIELARSRENPIVVSNRMSNDEKFSTKSARRLYIYSKEDLITAWQAVEKHAAEAKQAGYQVDCSLSEGSGHVEHMRRWPERYWRLIGDAWSDAIGEMVVPKARL